MIYVNLIIIVFFALLALLSRKHYSKYKDIGGIKGFLIAYWISMGECAWLLLEKLFPVDGIKNRLMENLRKTQVVPKKKLALMTQEYLSNVLAMVLIILFTFNLVEMGNCIYKSFLEDGKNIIEREEYGGDVKQEEICYEVDGQGEIYVLEVSPVRLSEEEFYEKADKVAEEMREKYFKQGSLISQDIELPLSDSENVFSISWISENPEIVSSRGRLRDDMELNTSNVSFRMIVEYYDYSAEYSFSVTVGPKTKNQKEIMAESLGQALNNLESESVGEKTFTLPEEIDGTTIRLKDKVEKNGRFLLVGLFLSIAVLGIFISRNNEEVSRRDRELMYEYPFFVDSLWLYIETGMNIKRALGEYIQGRQESILVKELKYTLNQVDTGMAEYTAYEELGSRLALPVYGSLMRHISQNLKMGTKDLRVLMEVEVETVLKTRKENAKKKGEEASTKLVFPMIALLLVVMIIVMTPAFMGF